MSEKGRAREILEKEENGAGEREGGGVWDKERAKESKKVRKGVGEEASLKE